MRRLTCTVFVVIAVLTAILFLYTRTRPDLPALRGTRADVVEASYQLFAKSKMYDAPLPDASIDLIFDDLRDAERTRGKKSVILASFLFRYRSGETDSVLVYGYDYVCTDNGSFQVNTQALVQKLLNNGTFKEPPMVW